MADKYIKILIWEIVFSNPAVSLQCITKKVHITLIPQKIIRFFDAHSMSWATINKKMLRILTIAMHVPIKDRKPNENSCIMEITLI